MKLLSQSEMGAAIAALRSGMASAFELAHQVVVSGLAHTRDHGDYTGLVSAVNALPSGARRETLVQKWIPRFSGKQLSVYRDKKTGTYVGKLAAGWKAEAFDIDGAMAVEFGDIEAEKVQKTLDLRGLRALVAKIANNTGSNANGTEKVQSTTRAFASKFVAQIDEAIAAAKA